MKISTKKYIDKQFEWQEKLRQADLQYLKAEISSMRRAVDKYSDNNDEWKTTHNNLQRKIDDQGRDYIKRGELWAVAVGIAMFVLGVAMYLKK